MKTKLVGLSDFVGHSHPSSKLFRAIELKIIHQNCKNVKLSHPSVDIGCGDGYISSILFDQKFTYGVDNGEAHDVHIAIKKKRYKKILIESAEKMSLKNNSVNFVFSNSVIEHIPHNYAVLSEVSRILKKGGIFIFTSPSHLFLKYLYISNLLFKYKFPFLGNWYAKKRNQMLNHYHLYSHNEWRKKLSVHQLKIIKYQYYISKECLMFWDKLALNVKIQKIFDKNSENNLYKKHKFRIKEFYNNDQIQNDSGASLFIYAKKND